MTFLAEEVAGKGSELGHALSWRDQMLSLRRHTVTGEKKRKGKWAKRTEEKCLLLAAPGGKRILSKDLWDSFTGGPAYWAWGHPKPHMLGSAITFCFFFLYTYLSQQLISSGKRKQKLVLYYHLLENKRKALNYQSLRQLKSK